MNNFYLDVTSEDIKKISLSEGIFAYLLITLDCLGFLLLLYLWSMSQSIRIDTSPQGEVGVSRSSTLRPPSLFRSIGLSGLSASMPPHRRLRSIFCRSRAVLPTNSHNIETSDLHTFTDILTNTHALSQEIRPNTMLNVLKPEVDSDLHRRAVFRSGVFADTLSLVSANPNPKSQSGQQNRQLFSHCCPTARASVRNTGRQGRLVTPIQTSDDPVIKAKQQKRKRSYKVDCTGRQKYVVSSLTEEEKDARLCEWLQSLGIADSNVKDTIATNSQQRLFVSRCRGVMSHREPDTAASHRRDRRPHFLPPICQPDSLLHVPQLLPKNSPPPSPCTHPDAPINPLPTWPLQPLSSRRKWEAVVQSKRGNHWLPQVLRSDQRFCFRPCYVLIGSQSFTLFEHVWTIWTWM